MIRVANIDDLNNCIDAARAFFESMNRSGFNPEAFTQLWTAIIEQDTGFILARFDGPTPSESLGILIYPDPFTGLKSASVAFWHVDGRSRGLEGGLLFNSLLTELDIRVVFYLYFAAQHNERMNKVTHFLARNQFEAIETVYRMEL